MKMPSQMFVAVTATLHRFILRLKMFRGKKFPCPAWGWIRSDFSFFSLRMRGNISQPNNFPSFEPSLLM